jgi:hypothetical protein
VSDSTQVPATSPAESADTLGNLLAATTDELASYLGDAHPADGATVLGRLPRDRAADVAGLLNPQAAALLLREMHPALSASVAHRRSGSGRGAGGDQDISVVVHVLGQLSELLLPVRPREAVLPRLVGDLEVDDLVLPPARHG